MKFVSRDDPRLAYKKYKRYLVIVPSTRQVIFYSKHKGDCFKFINHLFDTVGLQEPLLVKNAVCDEEEA